MRKLMKCASLILLILTLAAGTASANDVDAYSVSLQNYTGTPKTVDVQFSLDQKNVSATNLVDGNGAAYYDRIWVFVKYFNTAWPANHAWGHATLVAGGSIGAYSGTTGVGFTADGKGAFCRVGVNQTLRWAAGTDENLDGTEIFKVRVFAIEMVRVPTGAFWAGDNATSTAAFRQSSTTTTPWHITSESEISITPTGDSSGAEASYYYVSNSQTGEDTTGSETFTSIPAAFPKGYAGFYLMKYDVSMGQYVDFLNTLTREQQKNRIGTSITSSATTVTNIYVMANNAALTNRNTIVCPATITANVPIPFSTTTPARAGNFLNWADNCAYADWAGLRPMTELEYEKACRGRLSATNTAAANVVSGEYAWGTASVTQATTVVNDGLPTEAAGQTGSNTNGLCNCANSAGSFQGPLRSGFAATSSTTRASSGASYYGVMDLSGNLWKRSVTLGNPTGRAFDGKEGDGYLVSTGGAYDGNANGNNTGALLEATNSHWSSTSLWPGYTSGQGVSTTTAVGAGFRGGAWNRGTTGARVSDRYSAAITDSDRLNDYGVRCVRTE